MRTFLCWIATLILCLTALVTAGRLSDGDTAWRRAADRWCANRDAGRANAMCGRGVWYRRPSHSDAGADRATSPAVCADRRVSPC